jgi:CRISPR-associated protein Cmr1
MQTITFTCKTISTMFLVGADGNSPELRAPAFKAAMRYWWRAMNADKIKRESEKWNYECLKKAEVELFGGASDNEQNKKTSKRSSIIIQIPNIDDIASLYEGLCAHNPSRGKGWGIKKGTEFKVILRFRKEHKEGFWKTMFILTSLLGGVGKRSRRGSGSYAITHIDDEKYTPTQDINEVCKLLNTINPKFTVNNNKIVSNFGKTPDYPYIKDINIGKPDSNIMIRVGNTTHRLKKSDAMNYEKSLGHVTRGRLASPVYVSLIAQNVPIVTRLNSHQPNISIQDEFIQAVI